MDQLIDLILQSLLVLLVTVAECRYGNAGTHVQIFLSFVIDQIHSFTPDEGSASVVGMYKMLVSFPNIHNHPPFLPCRVDGISILYWC